MHKKLYGSIAGILLFIAALPTFADPPSQVGRVSHVSGQVSFRADKDDEWTEATLNYPVTSHNGFATSPDSRLEIRVGSVAIRADEDSEISIPRLDDDLIRVNVKRGVANVTVRSRESRYSIEILTPAGKVKLNGEGAFRFDAGRDNEPVSIAAFQGSASLDSGEGIIQIQKGRELIIERIDPLEYRVRNAQRGPFEDWVFARDQRIDRSRSPRYVSAEIAGHEDLDEYGDWQETTEYGTVWAPRITVIDWAPYRYGRWAWVEPWGWTWIDYAPWGFAPFHYGRWVYFQGRWGWAPGTIVARPVYAPALVAFVGRANWSVSFSFGTAPAVGWVPLGYRDLYRPAYRSSPTYVRNINITNINVRHVNVTNVNWSNPPTSEYPLRKFPHAVTVVPRQSFASGKPVMNQAAKLTAPVSEPVVNTIPHVAAPARRIVASEPPVQQKHFALPDQQPNPQTAVPRKEEQRRGWRGSEPSTVQEGSGNVVRTQPPVRPNSGHTNQEIKVSPPPTPSTPGNQRTTPPPAYGYEPNQAPRHPHRNIDNQQPRVERMAPPQSQPAPERPRPIREHQVGDSERKHPHAEKQAPYRLPADEKSQTKALPKRPNEPSDQRNQGEQSTGAGRWKAQ